MSLLFEVIEQRRGVLMERNVDTVTPGLDTSSSNTNRNTSDNSRYQEEVKQ
jgi:hypothetical protein